MKKGLEGIVGRGRHARMQLSGGHKFVDRPLSLGANRPIGTFATGSASPFRVKRRQKAFDDPLSTNPPASGNRRNPLLDARQIFIQLNYTCAFRRV